METSVPVSLKEAAEQSDALFVLLFLGEHSPSALEKVDALDQAIQATLWFPSPRLSPQQRASLDRSRRLILEILLLTGASVNQRCSSGWTASERVLSLGRVGVAASTVHDWVTNHGANWTDAVKALQLPLRDGLEAFLAENGYEVIQEQPLDEEPAPETKNDNQADMMELSSDSDDPLLPSPAKDPSLDLERAPLSPSQEPPTCDPRQQSASSSSSSSTPAPALSHSFTTPAFAAVLRLQFVPALLYDTAPKIELEVIQLLTTVIVRSHIGPINIQRDRDPMRQEYYIFVAVRTEADVTSALEGLHRARFRKKDLTLSRQRHLAAVPVVDLFWDQQRPAVSKAELANLAAASRLPEPTPGIGGPLEKRVDESRGQWKDRVVSQHEAATVPKKRPGSPHHSQASSSKRTTTPAAAPKPAPPASSSLLKSSSSTPIPTPPLPLATPPSSTSISDVIPAATPFFAPNPFFFQPFMYGPQPSNLDPYTRSPFFLPPPYNLPAHFGLLPGPTVTPAQPPTPIFTLPNPFSLPPGVPTAPKSMLKRPSPRPSDPPRKERAATSRTNSPLPISSDLPSTVEERRRLCLIKPTSLSPTSYRIFEPLSEPPSHLFSRTLPLPVSFGFVPRPVASTALRQPQPYSSRIVQDAFDEFLRTQAGIDCEHYDGVLEFLEGVGAKAREFEERARVEVDRARKARGRR